MRIKRGVNAVKKRRKILKLAKGYFGGRSNCCISFVMFDYIYCDSVFAYIRRIMIIMKRAESPLLWFRN